MVGRIAAIGHRRREAQLGAEAAVGGGGADVVEAQAEAVVGEQLRADRAAAEAGQVAERHAGQCLQDGECGCGQSQMILGILG